MAERILMTALSPTMEDGTIVSWQKRVGDVVNSGDVLCEVETDKATMSYEATQEGVLLKVVVPVGGSAKVGEMIGVIGSAGEDPSPLLTAQPAPTAASAPPIAPSTAVGATPVAAPSAAPVSNTAQAVGTPAATNTATLAVAAADIKASPLARKLAAERNINLRYVQGSGPGGRITKRDIEQFRGVPMSAVAGAADVSATVPGSTRGNVEIPVAGKRAVIASRLSESKFSAPHYYLKVSVRMEAVLNARALLNQGRKDKVSLNAFFIKFAAEALKRHPIVNASWQGDKIVQFGSIDIGLAVDLGTGLITPVVRDCGNRGVVEIDRDLQQLIAKTAEGKLRPEEYTGATFTISNLGSFGVEEFTAIINPPGSAILALGQTKATPVVTAEGTIGVGQVMKMTLSCDHRVIDGAAGGRFLSELMQMMEEPARLLF